MQTCSSGAVEPKCISNVLRVYADGTCQLGRQTLGRTDTMPTDFYEIPFPIFLKKKKLLPNLSRDRLGGRLAACYVPEWGIVKIHSQIVVSPWIFTKSPFRRSESSKFFYINTSFLHFVFFFKKIKKK